MGTAPGVCCSRSGMGSRRVWEDGSCIDSICPSSVLSSNLARFPVLSSHSLPLFLGLILLGRVFSNSGQGKVG